MRAGFADGAIRAAPLPGLRFRLEYVRAVARKEHPRQARTPEIYLSVDVEADGPIPGPYSMLSFGIAAFSLAAGFRN